jgi:hypothetical protein
MELKWLGFKVVPLNGIMSLQNIMKIYQAVQKLLVGDTQTRQTDTQTDWWFDKPTFIFGKQAKKGLLYQSHFWNTLSTV